MKIKKDIIISLLIILLIFFSENCWNIKLFGTDNINSFLYWKISAIAVILFFLTSKSFIVFIKRGSQFKRIWILFFISISISYLYGTYHLFGQSIFGLFKAYFWFSGVLIYFVLRKLNLKIEGVKYILKAIIFYGIFASIFSIFCSLFKPDIFIDSDFYSSERFGLTRVAGFAENPIALAFLISFFALFDKSTLSKSKYIFTFLFTGFTIFLVAMSRQMIVPLLILISIFLIKNILHKKEVRVFIAVIIFISILISPIIYNYIQSFVQSINYSSNNSVDAGSLEIRTLAVNYYYEMFKTTNNMGFGWFSVSSDANSNIISNATNKLNFRLVDLGIFSTLFMFGIFGLIVTFLYLKKGFNLLNKKSDFLTKGIKYYLIFKILSLSYFFYWPTFTIFFGLIAYLIEKLNEENIEPQEIIT